jgi:hypothetical protein
VSPRLGSDCSANDIKGLLGGLGKAAQTKERRMGRLSLLLAWAGMASSGKGRWPWSRAPATMADALRSGGIWVVAMALWP